MIEQTVNLEHLESWIANALQQVCRQLADDRSELEAVAASATRRQYPRGARAQSIAKWSSGVLAPTALEIYRY